MEAEAKESDAERRQRLVRKAGELKVIPSNCSSEEDD